MTATPSTATTADGLLSSLATSRRHVLSERTNDVVQVMATISQQTCYMMPDVTSADAELVVLTDREGVRDFYSKERTFMEVISSTLLLELASDWYTFLEAVSTTRQVATGTLHQNEVIVLFPVADDGIIGEILAARRKWVDVYAGGNGRPPATAPDGELATWRGAALGAHERLLGGLRTGDVDDAAAAFESDAYIAVVDHGRQPLHVFTGTGSDAARQRCRLMTDAVEDRELTLLNRVVGEWYVFAEWIVHGRARAGRLYGMEGGEAVEIRSVSIFPVGESRLLGGEHGYSVLRRLP